MVEGVSQVCEALDFTLTPGGGGFTVPPLPTFSPGPPPAPFEYPAPGGAAAYPPAPTHSAPYPPLNYNIPPAGQDYRPELNNLNSLDEGAPPPYFPPDEPKQQQQPPAPATAPNMLDLPDLPVVPSDTPLKGNTPPGGQDEDIDFDDLTKRFEALKKKK